MAPDKIDEFLAQIDTLPPTPHPLPELFRALTDSDSDTGKVVELISLDPPLTAKLLQTCNSAYFGGSLPANSVAEAVNRLGFRAVYRVVATVKGTQLLRPVRKAHGIDVAGLWRHSVLTAFAAEYLAEDAGLDGGLFYTAGLLHDIGKVVLSEAFKEDYARIAARAPLGGAALAELERTAFGLDHAEAGSRLLLRWKFSDELAVPVQFHHRPAAAAPFHRGAAYVSIATSLAHQHELELEGTDRLRFEPTEGLKVLEWGRTELTPFCERLKKNTAFVETMFRAGG